MPVPFGDMPFAFHAVTMDVSRLGIELIGIEAARRLRPTV